MPNFVLCYKKTIISNCYLSFDHQQPTSPAVQQDISSVNQQQAASLANEKRPLSNTNQQLISTVDNQQISYIERPQREKKEPSKYIPEDGTCQSNSRSVCEEANIVMIPKDRHCDSAVIESKKTELANWRQMEAIDVVGDKAKKVISTKVGFNRKEYPDGEIKPKARLVIRGF